MNRDLKKEPTLIDQIYRRTFKGRQDLVVRDKLINARKFILDDSMSAFLADLGSQVFTKQEKDLLLIDAMRVSARLPHEITWVEFNMRTRMRRLVDEYDRTLDPSQSVERFGWLLEQHKTQDTAFRCTMALGGGQAWDIDAYIDPFLEPWSMTWTVDNSEIPWERLEMEFPKVKYGDDGTERSGVVAEMATGVIGFHSPFIGLTRNGSGSSIATKGEAMMFRESIGELRYIWAFLATLNDVPTFTTTIKGERGFVAKGRYRKFLDHHVITLKIPNKSSLRKIAAKAVVHVKRRGGPVRGHWRTYERLGPHGESPCPLHSILDWTPTNDPQHQRCKKCHSFRTWIAPYVKGDASIGFVTHDYVVKHD